MLSADGTIVGFTSGATNLADGDTNGQRDLFARDLTAGITTRASISGAQADGGSSLTGDSL